MVEMFDYDRWLDLAPPLDKDWIVKMFEEGDYLRANPHARPRLYTNSEIESDLTELQRSLDVPWVCYDQSNAIFTIPCDFSGQRPTKWGYQDKPVQPAVAPADFSMYNESLTANTKTGTEQEGRRAVSEATPTDFERSELRAGVFWRFKGYHCHARIRKVLRSRHGFAGLYTIVPCTVPYPTTELCGVTCHCEQPDQPVGTIVRCRAKGHSEEGRWVTDDNEVGEILVRPLTPGNPGDGIGPSRERGGRNTITSRYHPYPYKKH